MQEDDDPATRRSAVARTPASNRKLTTSVVNNVMNTTRTTAGFDGDCSKRIIVPLTQYKPQQLNI